MFTALLTLALGCGSTRQDPTTEVQRAKAGALDVVLLADRDALAQGKGTSLLEFRGTSDQRLVDVGQVKVSATMPMAGMAPMIAAITARPSGVPGRYTLETDFGMAGSWRIGVEWNGPAGQGSATLPSQVQ
jgi:hypothetical protein